MTDEMCEMMDRVEKDKFESKESKISYEHLKAETAGIGAHMVWIRKRYPGE
jgi:hypothetical protein